MNIKRNYSLKSLNSFGLDVVSTEFLTINSVDEVIELAESRNLVNEKYLILGEGSNILFSGDFDGLIIKSNLSNIKVIDDSVDSVLIESGSGVVWDDLVAYCVEKGYHGIENLSLIPGTAGAAPIQNIGAYGIE